MLVRVYGMCTVYDVQRQAVRGGYFMCTITTAEKKGRSWSFVHELSA